MFFEFQESIFKFIPISIEKRINNRVRNREKGREKKEKEKSRMKGMIQERMNANKESEDP